MNNVIEHMNEQKRRASYLTLNDDGDIVSVEIVFYTPIPIIDFSIDKILAGKCGGCGERYKKEG